MKRLILLFVLFACGTATQAQKAKKAKNSSIELKVMTYNVHHCNPPGTNKIDPEGVAKVIAAEAPDIVFLQEIDDHNERGGKNINEAEVIAKQLGMNYYFGKAIDYAGGGYGIAILSKFNLSESQVYSLPKVPKKAEPRVLLTAVATLNNQQKIKVACTHLDIVTSENRAEQTGKIVEVLKNESMPVILGGDFNDTLKSKAINTVMTTFKSVCNPCQFTDPADKPEDTIDFIFMDKKHNWKIKSYTVGADDHTSDHRYVISKIAL